jgi:hypothetical protein
LIQKEKVIKRGKKKFTHTKEKVIIRGKIKYPLPSHVWR